MTTPTLALALAFSLKYNVFYTRYWSFLYPPFAVMVAAGIVGIVSGFAGVARYVAGIGVLALALTPGLLYIDAYYRSRPFHNWRAAGQELTASAGPDDVIFFVPTFARIAFEYYFPGKQERIVLEPEEILDPALRKPGGRLDVARLQAVARRHSRLWIVATAPVGYQARKELGEILAPYFREVAGKDHGRVYTFLWEPRDFPK